MPTANGEDLELVAASDDGIDANPARKPTRARERRSIFDTWCAALIIAATASGALTLGWKLRDTSGLCTAANHIRTPVTWRLGAPYTRSLLSADGLASWRLRNSNSSIDIPQLVPGVAHEALLASGILRGDPLYRDNELLFQWVAYEDWTFAASFALDAAADAPLLSAPCTLRLQEVDTIATISVNGIVVGSTDSAFIRHDLPLPAGVLRAGDNSMAVSFRSALTAARERAARYPYTVPHTHYFQVWSEPSSRNFVRKPASDYGWDWGPSFVPTGLLGPVTLRATSPQPSSLPQHGGLRRRTQSSSSFSTAAAAIPTAGADTSAEALAELEGLSISQSHLSDGSVTLSVSGWLGAGAAAFEQAETEPPALALDVTLCYPSCSSASVERWLGRGVLRRLAPSRGGSTTTGDGGDEAVLPPTLRIASPALWWPRGYGAANLYELRATLCQVGSTCKAGGSALATGGEVATAEGGGAEVDEEEGGAAEVGRTLVRRIGLRTVELIQEAALPPAAGMANGTSFFFRVNGVDVYAKGSNVIPAHVFATDGQASGKASGGQRGGGAADGGKGGEGKLGGERDGRWRWLLEQAASSNQNMVRVWGGGRYQPDSFYDLASELGLMVWQEMIFACALYPRDERFLSLVDHEVRQQVARLATHASIVIWGGNNENEGEVYVRSAERCPNPQAGTDQ